MNRFHGTTLLLYTLFLASSLSVAAAEPPSLLWADFKEAQRSHNGAPVQPIAMSERAGDATGSPLRLADSAVQVEGRLSTANGSQWATLGIDIAGDSTGAPIDLTSYHSIKIRLASAKPRVLRVRLKGRNPAALSTGCYPVVMQQIGPAATNYVIPLAAFGPEPHCGARGATPEQTLPAVTHVEVTANEPSSEPVRFAVGRIEFLRADTPAAAVAAASPGTAHLTRDTRWSLAWSDEFNAPAGRGIDATRWSIATAAQPSSAVRAVFADSAREIAHDGQGHLAIAAHNVSDAALVCRDGPCTHASGKLQAKPQHAILYGRVEIRFKPPKVPGLAASMSLLGAPLMDLPWPEGGEIILLETHGRQAKGSVALYAPGVDDDTFRASVPLANNASPDQFHVAAVEWDPVQVRWLLDDVPVKTVARSDLPERTGMVFDTWPFLLHVGLLVGADGAGDLPDKLPAHAKMLVDYVRVFQRDDLASATRTRMARWNAQYTAQTTAPQKESQRKRASGTEAAPPSQPVRQVTCTRDNKYELMMCR